MDTAGDPPTPPTPPAEPPSPPPPPAPDEPETAAADAQPEEPAAPELQQPAVPPGTGTPPPPTAPPDGPAPKTPENPVFDAQNILWHFGALSATVAALAVIGQVHPAARGFWILLVSLLFAGLWGGAAFALLGSGWRIPGGILAATAVSFVPAAGEGLERLIGVWGSGAGTSNVELGPSGVNVGAPIVGERTFNGHGFALAVATAVAGLLVYAFVRYAFVFAWVAVATLLAVQLLLPLWDSHPSGAHQADTFLISGLAFLAIGFYADLVHARRIAFWWHLVGLLVIAGAFSFTTATHQDPGWALVLVAGVIVLVAAAPLHRATWAIFGLLGTWAPLVHYTGVWFGGLGTAFSLFVIGLLIVAAGLAVHRAGAKWTGLLVRRPRPV